MIGTINDALSKCDIDGVKDRFTKAKAVIMELTKSSRSVTKDLYSARIFVRKTRQDKIDKEAEEAAAREAEAKAVALQSLGMDGEKKRRSKAALLFNVAHKLHRSSPSLDLVFR